MSAYPNIRHYPRTFFNFSRFPRLRITFAACYLKIFLSHFVPQSRRGYGETRRHPQLWHWSGYRSRNGISGVQQNRWKANQCLLPTRLALRYDIQISRDNILIHALIGSRDNYNDENQAQRDARAFQELQRYADFQRVLSNRVQDDIYRDEMKYTPIDPQILQNQTFGDYFSHQPYVHPSLQQPRYRGRLQYPVVIPQRRPEDKSRGWVRAYAPALMDCGIDQYTFLNFLDAFNESSKVSHPSERRHLYLTE